MNLNDRSHLQDRFSLSFPCSLQNHEYFSLIYRSFNIYLGNVAQNVKQQKHKNITIFCPANVSQSSDHF